MLTLEKVAITGSLSSGKTTVCQFFERWGAYVVSADHLLHHAFSTDDSLRRRISTLFGEEVFEGPSLSRERVANIVIHETKLLTQLEEICHPYVNQEIRRHYLIATCAGKHSLFVAEVPLLFESRFSLWPWFDATVVVISDRSRAKERYVQAGGTEEQFDFREARQMPAQEKSQRAHYTLINNGTLEELEVEAKILFNVLNNKTP